MTATTQELACVMDFLIELIKKSESDDLVAAREIATKMILSEYEDIVS